MANEMVGSVDRIDPKTLRTLRKRKAWSQRDLAERCECRTEQISRWERGKENPQPRLRQKLCRALGVRWEELTRPLPNEHRSNIDEALKNVQLNTRINLRERNALTIVCQRYGVHPGEVIGLAPLLFLIAAEQSLAWRSERADAVAREADALPARLPHIEQELHIGRARIEDAISAEERSIESCDVFGRHLELENSIPGNPLMAYLEANARPLIADGLVGYIDAEYPGENDYLVFAKDDLKRVTGLTGDRPVDKEIMKCIWFGAISLEKVLEQRSNLDRTEYLKWLDDQHSSIRESTIDDVEDLMREMLAIADGHGKDEPHVDE